MHTLSLEEELNWHPRKGFQQESIYCKLSGVIAQLTRTMFFYQTKIAYLWSGMPILDWWLVVKCLTSVIKSVQEMQMCWQMGVWTSVDVQCTIVRMCVSRPVSPSTWHRLEVWTSVEVFKSKCWVVQCMALPGGVEVLKCESGWKSLIYHPRQAPGQEVDRGPNWFYFTL